MAKVYKNAEDFLKENFPKSYLVIKNEEETSLQYHIDALSEELNENISKILKGELSTSHKKKSAQTSAP
jgi:hypothetical protein